MSLYLDDERASRISKAIREADHKVICSNIEIHLRAVFAADNIPLMISHPLGFLCMPIYRSDAVGLCVHIWMRDAPAARPTTSGMHLHTWDLHSHILAGGIRNSRIEVSPEDTEPSHRIFDVVSTDKDVDTIKRTERTVTYRTIDSTDYHAGQTYTVDSFDFHEAAVLYPNFTATAVLAQDWGDEPQQTLGRLDGDSHVVHRERCAAVDARRAGTRLLDSIAGTA